jgi:hypothetical protein
LTGFFTTFFFAVFFVAFFFAGRFAAFFFADFFLAPFLFADFFFAGFFFTGLRRVVAMNAKGSWYRVARQPQHPFGENISLYLPRSSTDGQCTSKEIPVDEPGIGKRAERWGNRCPA